MGYKKTLPVDRPSVTNEFNHAFNHQTEAFNALFIAVECWRFHQGLSLLGLELFQEVRNWSIPKNTKTLRHKLKYAGALILRCVPKIADIKFMLRHC